MAKEYNFIGRQIGNYRILEELASGSFGRVYRGAHIYLTKRIVAIKLLHRMYLGSQKERESFLQEAQLLELLKHPRILPIYDVGIEDGMPYFVTEYASHGSLRDRLQRQYPQHLPVDETITILTQVGEALFHAHHQNIIHRDLKPENILFNAKNEALLADFGIATLLEAARTKHADVSGSPSYMAPEQFDGIISKKSDQYALGCIAYELVTGRKPFIVPHPTMEAMWYQHSQVNPVSPTQFNRQLPLYIEQAILKAMGKDRKNRYPDVGTFIADLQKSPKQWLDEGYAHRRDMRYEDALLAYDQAIRLDSGYALAYSEKANILWFLKRYEEALVVCERAIQLEPNNAIFHNNRGLVLQNLKRNEDALGAYERAIQLDANYALAYYNKGNLLYDSKHYEEAIEDYGRAIQLNPSYVYAYYSKGNALYELNRYEDALAAYEQVIQFDPNFTDALKGKEKAIAGSKRYEEALAAETDRKVFVADNKQNNNDEQIIYLSPEEELTNVRERLQGVSLSPSAHVD